MYLWWKGLRTYGRKVSDYVLSNTWIEFNKKITLLEEQLRTIERAPTERTIEIVLARRAEQTIAASAPIQDVASDSGN